MKDLIIIGAGGFGKEALVIAQEMNKTIRNGIYLVF